MKNRICSIVHHLRFLLRHLCHQFELSIQLTHLDTTGGLREGEKCSQMTMWQNKPLQLASGGFMAYMLHGSALSLLDNFTREVFLA